MKNDIGDGMGMDAHVRGMASLPLIFFREKNN